MMMREKIALAIGSGLDVADPLVGNVVGERELFDAADAVLAAMREPTEAMVAAGVEWAERCDLAIAPTDGYREMIDAAIEPPT